MSTTYRRIGDESKCPACGWRLDSEAYRCPKCLIYFCFKCRKRIPKDEVQYQCANQACSYYGKLLCSACTTTKPAYEDKVQHETVLTKPAHTGFGGPISILCAIAFLVLWGCYSFAAALLLTIILFAGACAFFSQLLEVPFESQHAQYEQVQKTVHVEAGEHRCCIACGQPAENVSD